MGWLDEHALGELMRHVYNLCGLGREQHQRKIVDVSSTPICRALASAVEGERANSQHTISDM